MQFQQTSKLASNKAKDRKQIMGGSKMKKDKAQADVVVDVQADNEVDVLAGKALEALRAFLELDQATVDNIIHAMAMAGMDNYYDLAEAAVVETGRGVLEDKVIKNMFSSEYIYHDIKGHQTVGVIEKNDLEGYVEVAEPVGVVAGITPVTNPTSTTMFKAIICMKTRNPIVFAFHPSAQKSSTMAAKLVYEAALRAGAPENCIQWIERPTLQKTNQLMNHQNVSLILATGGAAMVKSAYSAGKPALGVGPGNVPCYINENVDLKRACNDLVVSKTFDNGMICASEQAVIVDKSIAEAFEKEMTKLGCYFVPEVDIPALSNYVIDPVKGVVNPVIVGQSASWIAERAGIDCPAGAKILIAALPEPAAKYPLSLEKLSPVLAYFRSEDADQGIEYARKMLELGGMGHSAVIHSDDDELCTRYGKALPVGRIIANAPSSQGAIGDIYNANNPSLTLGCGSYGQNSTTANVSSVNLINKKRTYFRRNNMQWMKLPPKIYFERGSIRYLEDMPNITRAFIVTDPTMVELGYVDRILYYLRKRTDYVHSEIYSDVEPDPSVETIRRGVAAMNQFKPDVIIALGGGSAMDAAKCMWLFYEHPESNFDSLRLKFMDIRKRTYHYPNLGSKSQMVCIPTTSGTGSEVTSFSVITDKENGNIKYPLADYELTPDVAIIDSQFTDTMPKTIVADTGLDVLTHAIEAYVSVMASDYTDGLALQAISQVFEYLVRSYENPTDRLAREKMHNASAIAGMAFTNAFLGINHSLAHKLGSRFHIAHGRANAILLPHVIRYNATMPVKFAIWPKYTHFIADERYAQISRYLGLGGSTIEEQVEALATAIESMMLKLNVPQRVRDCGLDLTEEEYQAALADLSRHAFEDQCTNANPRYPLVSELKAIYQMIW